MATEYVKIIDTNGAASPDYTSLNAWEAGEQARDYISNDEISVAKCRASSGVADSTKTTIAGWSYLDEDHYIKIWTDPEEGYRHNGVYASGNIYRFEVENDDTIIIQENFVKIYGLAFNGISNTSYIDTIFIEAASGNIDIEQCIFKGNFVSGADAIAAISMSIIEPPNFAIVRIANCLIYDYVNGSNGIYGIWTQNGYRVYIYNETIFNTKIGISYHGADVTKIVNCIYDSNGISGAIGYEDAPTDNGSDFNISDLGDAPGPHSQSGVCSFLNEGQRDFHLFYNDVIAKSQGSGITENSDIWFTTDIDNDNRTANEVWDIGADQFTRTVYKTVGSAPERDYSTWSSWAADLGVSGIYHPTQNAIGIGYNDSIFEEIIDIDGDGESLGLKSVKITVASGERHNGIADTGVKLLNPSNYNNAVLWMEYSAGGPYATVEWLEIDGDNLTPNRFLFNSVLEFRPASGVIRNCIVHNGKNSLIVANVSPTPIPGHRYVLNNIVYDVRKTGSLEQIEGIAAYVNPGNETQVKNNTVYGILNYSSGNVYGVDNSTHTQAINNIVIGVSGMAIEKCFSGTGGISDYNISSDSSAPGANSLLNKIAQNQFISTLEGTEDLHLRIESDAVNAGSGLGIVPEGINIDIDGRDRVLFGDTWDIGADERIVVKPSMLWFILW